MTTPYTTKFETVPLGVLRPALKDSEKIVPGTYVKYTGTDKSGLVVAVRESTADVVWNDFRARRDRSWDSVYAKTVHEIMEAEDAELFRILTDTDE